MASLDAELEAYIRVLQEESIKASVLHREKQVIKLANVLHKIEATARMAQYCIVDIADLAG